MKEKILVVDDEKNIADAIAYALRKEGYRVETAYNGEDALTKFDWFRPDVVILDVMLPGIDGYDVLRKLENRGPAGVIMLTAKEDIVNKVLGLELGADDYITKPFDMRELLARLKSLIRRLQTKAADAADVEIRIHGLTLNLQQRKAVAGNQTLELTPKEFDLLALLLAHPERVYTREQLLDLIWSVKSSRILIRSSSSSCVARASSTTTTSRSLFFSSLFFSFLCVVSVPETFSAHEFGRSGSSDTRFLYSGSSVLTKSSSHTIPSSSISRSAMRYLAINASISIALSVVTKALLASNFSSSSSEISRKWPSAAQSVSSSL